MKSIIKCRFCNWSRPRFITKKVGGVQRIVEQFHALENHVEDTHRAEWRKYFRLFKGHMRMLEEEEAMEE